MYGNHITCDYYRHPLLLSASHAAVRNFQHQPTYIRNIASGTAHNGHIVWEPVNESLLSILLPVNKKPWPAKRMVLGGRPEGRVVLLGGNGDQPKNRVYVTGHYCLSAVVKIQHEIIHKYFILIHGHYVQVHLSAASVFSPGPPRLASFSLLWVLCLYVVWPKNISGFAATADNNAATWRTGTRKNVG